jgi:hypothetical protein
VRSHAKATSAIAAIGCAIFLACICASPALAAKGVVGFVGEAGVQGGQFANPGGAAVNLNGTGGAAAGDLYVVDRGNNRVQQFHADGTWVRAFGRNVGGAGVNVCEVKASCVKSANSAAAGGMTSPQGAAIEQSTGLVYVTDQNNRRVDVFSAIGVFQGAFGWEVDSAAPAEELQLCTTSCQAGAISTEAGGFFVSDTGYPAFDPQNGDLLVPQKTSLRVSELTPTISAGTITGISFVRAFGWGVDTGAAAFETCTTASGCQAGTEGEGLGQFAVSSPTSVAADSNGRIYALDAFNNRVQAFSSTPTPEGVFAESRLSGEPRAISLAVDPTTNHLYVTKPCTTLSCPGAPSEEHRVLELDSTGNLVESQAAKAGITSSTGLGLGASGRTYMTTKEGGPSGKPGFFILDTLVSPLVTVEPVSTFTGTTATFEGHVTTDTIDASYHLEYSANGTEWSETSTETLAGDSSSHAVSKEVQGLEAHTEYQVRLIAVKRYAGGSASAQTSFTTGAAPPVIESVSHSHVRDTSALLEATINPENEDTEFHFEYADEATYEAEGFTSATSIPAPPGHLNGGAPRALSQQLAGLDPATTYVYRLLVSNPTGDDESVAGSFTTHTTPQSFDACSNDEFRINRPSQILPDCRAYEQASPIDKNGGNIQTEFELTKASPSGDRISFLSVTGLPGGEGSQTFPTFLASRGGGQWSTQGVLPAASTGERARILGWTPDFDQVFSFARRYGTGATLLSRSSAGGSLATISPYSEALEQHTPDIRYVGASADGSKAFFDVIDALPVAPGSPTPAAGLSSNGTRQKNLYVWNRESGDLYFAGALPDGSAAASGAQAGFASVDDSGYSIDSHAVAGDGSVYFTDQATGQLYRRLNPTEPETTNHDPISGECIPDPVLACTVHVSASEKTDGGGFENHDAAGPQATRFMAASTDGSKAIFTSSEKLTTDAYTGPEPDPAAIARADAEDGDNVDLSWLPTTADQIDIDETAGYIYWTDPTNGRIGRAKLDQSVIEPNLITGLHNLKDLAVIDEPGAEYVFWTSPADGEADFTSPVTGNGRIGRSDLTGTNPTLDCYTGLYNPGGIAASVGYIYWGAPFGGTIFGEGSLGRAALDCEAASAEQHFVENAYASGDIAVDSNRIYVSPYVGGSANLSRIQSLNLDGTRIIGSVDVKEVSGPVRLALDASHIYWTDPDHHRIGRAELDLTNENLDFIPQAGRASGIAVDSEYIFWSANQEQVPNDGSDIYSYDSKAPAGHRLTDLAPSHDGEDGIEVQGVLGASVDASYVYFVANGVPDGPIAGSPNSRGEEAQVGNCQGTYGDPKNTGTCNLYLAHGGEITFIARLDANRASTRESSTSDSIDWIASAGELGFAKDAEKSARVSPDGRTLLFRSQRQLTNYDNEGPGCSRDGDGGRVSGPCLEFYRYRVGEPGLVCVSCNPTGARPFRRAGLVSIVPGATTGQAPTPQLSRNLSADGNRVLFESADPLVAADTNGDEGCQSSGAFSAISCQDVYEWEAAGTGSCPQSAGQKGCIYLFSTGKSPDPSYFGDASLSGDDAFIVTYSKLVRQDEDDNLDIYDVSAGGGLASQDALPAVPCEGEACKGGTGSPAQSPSAGTQSFSGSANPKPAHKKAKKRKHAKKHRHAKKHHAKQHHRANANGRASR